MSRFLNHSNLPDFLYGKTRRQMRPSNKYTNGTLTIRKVPRKKAITLNYTNGPKVNLFNYDNQSPGFSQLAKNVGAATRQLSVATSHINVSVTLEGGQTIQIPGIPYGGYRNMSYEQVGMGIAALIQRELANQLNNLDQHIATQWFEEYRGRLLQLESKQYGDISKEELDEILDNPHSYNGRDNNQIPQRLDIIKEEMRETRNMGFGLSNENSTTAYKYTTMEAPYQYIGQIKKVRMDMVNSNMRGGWGQAFITILILNLYLFNNKAYMKLIRRFKEHKMAPYFVVTKSNCLFSAILTAWEFNSIQEYRNFRQTASAKDKKRFSNKIVAFKRGYIRYFSKLTFIEKCHIFFPNDSESSFYSDTEWYSNALPKETEISPIILKAFLKYKKAKSNRPFYGMRILTWDINSTPKFANFSVKELVSGRDDESRTVNLLNIADSHIVPLLFNENPDDWKLRVGFEKIFGQELVKSIKKVNRPVTKRISDTPKIFIYDLETFNINHNNRDMELGVEGVVVPYGLGAEVDGEIKIYMDIEKPLKGFDCIGRFIFDGLKNFFAPKNTFLAHNGAGFDSYFMLNWFVFNYFLLIEEGYVPKILSPIWRGGLQSFTVKIVERRRGGRKFMLTFRDTLPFLQGSLRQLAKAYMVKTQKGDLNYESIKWYPDVKEQEEKIVSYLRDDVKALSQVYSVIKQQWEDKYDIDISKFSSGAAAVRRIFFRDFYKPDVAPMYAPGVKLDRKLRKYYFGGRTETFFMGQIWDSSKPKRRLFSPIFKYEKVPYQVSPLDYGVYYADFTSWYPYQCQTVELPIGKAKVIKNQKIVTKSKLAKTARNLRYIKGLKPFLIELHYTHRQFTSSEPWKPFFPVAKDGRLLFPRATTMITTMATKEELIYLINNDFCGMEIRLGGVMILWEDGGAFLKDYIDNMFELKAECDRELRTCSNLERPKIEATRRASKLNVNSIYGLLGIKIEGSEVQEFRSDMGGSMFNSYQRGLGAKITTMDSSYKIISYKSLMNSTQRNVAVSLFITASARLGLYKLFKLCEFPIPPICHDLEGEELYSLMKYELSKKNNKYGIGERVIMCDTDSVISTNYNGLFQHVIMKLQQYKDGSDKPGGLTNEIANDGRIIELVNAMPKAYGYKDQFGWHLKHKGVKRNGKYTTRTLKRESKGNGEGFTSYVEYSGDYSPEYVTENNLEQNTFRVEDFKALIDGKLSYISFRDIMFKRGRTKIGGHIIRKYQWKKFKIVVSKGLKTDTLLRDVFEVLPPVFFEGQFYTTD